MHHIIIVKAAQHMDDSIRLADVSQELIAESLALAGTLHQSCDIDDLHRGRYHAALGLAEVAQLDESLIRHGDHAHVRLYRAERKIGRLRLGVTQTVKKGRFAHIRQTHYSTL